MIDFTRIKSGEGFELLCEDLLRAKGFRIVDKVARGPEGGKDLIVSETVTDRTGHTEERKTLVQCKHHAHSGKAVGFNDVANWRDVCDQYEVNRYLLICSTVPTEDLRKKFQSATKKGDRVTTIWARNDLERYLADHSDVRECYFPAEEPAYQLAQNVGGWLRALGYEVVSGPERCEEGHVDLTVEVKLEVPLIGKVTQRVLVRCIEGEIQAGHVKTLIEDIKAANASKGQLITDRRVASTAQHHAARLETVEVMTFDELIDATARFDRYLDWLEAEVKRHGIDRMYVPLACTKEEFDPVTKKKVGESRYNERNGWIDGYIDRWLDDPAKEHISILGEFGTGKTWFALHYAWTALQRYRQAKERGVERPRLPLVIPLRDYAKAVSVESLFSEFFFRKHEIPLPGYSAFEQLNRMGKLLLIFDGFDEMAAKVDRQKMINNFWELARVVVPGAKAILTCRTEHFPEAKEGRALLSAELQASTSKLTGEPPQFEVLELEKFDDAQIRQVLSLRAEPATVKQVMSNPQLLDLARRPVMTEFILEALPDIEAGKPVDLSRIYLYAVRRKMERDIKAERTFTSLADKLYFLCELSWEMLSTDQMSLNYRQFPDRLRRLFGPVVQEQKDLDHWHYDMMGQTMLIRNAEGDYTPAHRSLLEFFVAYKFVAELGALAPDLTVMAQQQSHLEESVPPQDYAWFSYFQRKVDETGAIKPISPLREFVAEGMKNLAETVGKERFTTAILELMQNMLGPNEEAVKERLLGVIARTRVKTMDDVGTTGGNVATLLIRCDPLTLKGHDLHEVDLSYANLQNPDLTGCNLRSANLQFVQLQNPDLTDCNLRSANLRSVQFRGGTLVNANLRDADLTDAQFSEMSAVNSVVFSPEGTMLASGGMDTYLHIWDVSDLKNVKEVITFSGHSAPLQAICWSAKGDLIASYDDDGNVYIWHLERQSRYASFRQTWRPGDIAFNGDDLLIWDISTRSIHVLSLQTRNTRALGSEEFDEKRYQVGTSKSSVCAHFASQRSNDARFRRSYRSSICLEVQIQSRRYALTLRLSFPRNFDLHPRVEEAAVGLSNRIYFFATDHPMMYKYYEATSEIGVIKSVSYDSTGDLIAAGLDDGTVVIFSTKEMEKFYPMARISQRLRCQNLQLAGAKGLDAVVHTKKVFNKETEEYIVEDVTLGQWLATQGAVLE